ncbi:MAG TPA: bifunctional diaminohydroxyphosphoribosylaminopyrimidine deaminase/5-amino-6-(5-phosphoribosylamino)uracil reductase RibD [Rhizomicrobium sp.]|nr:bifunctional diaminohydroxyphosphoribosylaminopyrimidine deaminase/5-amino-6-(5-phosphoribosylamino)uracil reductase RibD [Rhizomicrobium sp.]
MNDRDHMHHALTLAARVLGRTAPNPAVGCVIVSADGHIVGRGWTRDGGRPHAEVVALAQAGPAAKGATAYVTLEPCAHLGQTPPCAEALVKAGVARVVAAAEDPDSRVKGKGFAMLRDAGVEVVVGVSEKEAAALNAGFFLRVTKNRPLVTLKIAQSADGKTVRAGDDKWITGEDARRFGHLLRAKHDAILIGIRTALADDPELTCRLPGLERYSPLRIVLDTHLRLPETGKLARTARQQPTILFTTSDGGDGLRNSGVEVLKVIPDAQGRPDVGAVLSELARRGVTRLLVEGGATIVSAFRDFADRLEIFTAPLTLGNAGRGALTLETTDFLRVSHRTLGPDVLESFARRA